MDKSKIYLDFSKCTEEERKHIISMLPEPRNWKVYAMFDNNVFLNYNVDEWIVGSKIYIADKQEITYPEFIKLFEGGEGSKPNEHTCKYCGCLTTQSDDDCYANPKNTMETPNKKEQILKAFKEGKTIQSRDGSGWKDFIPQNQPDTPNLDYGGIDYWSIKPETIKSDNTQTLQNALQQIEKLEADKAVLLEALERGQNELLQFKEAFAPKSWIKADFRPEYDGRYLAHIVTKEECGNFTKRLEVVYFGYAKWSIKENERITHWMIVLPPDRTVTLL